MKKLFFYVAVVLATLSLSACSDDEDESNPPASLGNLAGTWQIIHEETWDNSEGEKRTWSENYPDKNGYYWTYSFDKSGNYVHIIYESGEATDTYNGTYSVSSDKIIVKVWNNAITWEIKKLTESELVLLYRLPYEEKTWTLKRIE